MPKASILGKFTCEGGYHPNQPTLGRPNGTFVAGEKMWVLPGGRIETGKDITQLSATNVQAVVQEIDTQRGYLPAGNLVRYPGGAIFGISEIANAAVFLDEVAAFNLSATAGELTVARESGGTWTAIPAGLPTPTLTTVSAASGGTKNMPAGDYSVRIARKRSWDEAYSGWSNAINVTLTAGQRVQVTFPAADAGSEQDQWIIAASKKAQNNTGPWYEVFDASEIEESALPGPRTYAVEWHDSDLKTLIQTDIQAAPVGRFLFMLDGILHLVARGGSATQPDSRIWPLLRNNPTMTRRAARTITANGHTIVGVLGGQDVALLMCKQSLQIATPTGLGDRPTTCRQRWDFGFYDQHAGVVVEGYFYGWSGRRLARTSVAELRDSSSKDLATPASEFTRPVDSLLRTFSAENIVIGFDPIRCAVIVFHRNIVAGTTTAVPFMHRDGVWSSPWTIQGLVYSATEVSGQLVLTLYTGGNYRGHTWDTNSTWGTAAYWSGPWCDAEEERFDKHLTAVDITANAAQAGLHIAERGTAKPPVNGAPTGARIWSLSGTDAVQATKDLNISNVALFAPYVNFTTPGQFLDEFTVSGDVVRLKR